MFPYAFHSIAGMIRTLRLLIFLPSAAKAFLVEKYYIALHSLPHAFLIMGDELGV